LEVIALNIARDMTSGEFVSSLTPTQQDLAAAEADRDAMQFLGTAAIEVAMKTYDDKLWKQSGALTEGGAEEQASVYIKLRSKRLADEAGRAKRLELLKRNAELTKQQGQAPIEIIGVYESIVRPGRGRVQRLDVVLAKSGKEIRGKFIPDNGDRISGWFTSSDRIEFHWTFADATYDRVGS